MKKTLLAAALLAGFAGAAQAETSVVLYGLIDTGIGYQQIKGNTYINDKSRSVDVNQSKVGLLNGVQGGARWGLRGTEDLGDGLRAVFNLESGFNSANGSTAQNGRLFGRRATVGLASDSWGRFDFGRQVSIATQYFKSIDPFALGFGQANMGMLFSAANTLRYDNTVMYQTSVFNDFQFGVGYSFNADDTRDAQTGWGTANNTRAITTGLRYANGPLNLALTYDQLNGSNQMNNKATPKQWIIGGSYDFEAVKLALAFGQTRDGWFASQDINTFGSGMKQDFSGLYMNSFVDNSKINSYMVGASAPLGGGSKIFASWMTADPKEHPIKDPQKWQTYNIGYTYDSSKRTNLYAMGSFSKNYYFFDGVKSTVFGVGVQHRF